MSRHRVKHGYFDLCSSTLTSSFLLILLLTHSAFIVAFDPSATITSTDETGTPSPAGSTNISSVINLSPTLQAILQPNLALVKNLEIEDARANNSLLTSTWNANSNTSTTYNVNYSGDHNVTLPVNNTTELHNLTKALGDYAENGSENGTSNPPTTVDPDLLFFLKEVSNVTHHDEAEKKETFQRLNGTTGDDRNGTEQRSLPLNDVQDEKYIKDKALENLMQIFGLAVKPTRDVSPGPAPEFMIDLYNTITDSYGVTRAKNPYDAHVVRSFTERDNSLNDFFYFNISGMEETETVLEAELHIHRTQTPHEQLHPSLYLTPFYILSLYQVLDPKNLAIPDLHKLLGVHYVPALGSGWEVFNVKQPVLKWLEGNTQPNHGFLVAATSLGGDRVPVRFSRRGENSHSKQPILVLFTHDSQMQAVEPVTRQPNKSVSRPTSRASNPGPETIKTSTNGTGQADTDDQQQGNIPTSSLENPRYHHALLFQDSIRHPNSVGRFRSRRSRNRTEGHGHINDTHGPPLRNLTSCGRHDLFVNFEAIGWSSWIISPKGYNAYYCDGLCSFPLGQQVNPSNHATVQSIVHKLNLAPEVGRPCCVPTTLLPISLLYYDNHDNVVLKQYVDMVADSCGCF